MLDRKVLVALVIGAVLGVVGVYAAQVFVAKITFVVSKPPAEIELKQPRIEVAPYQTYTIGGLGSDTVYIVLGTVKQYSDCVLYTVETSSSNIEHYKITIEFSTALMPGPAGKLGTVTLSNDNPKASIKICDEKVFYLYIVKGTIKTSDKDGYLEIKIEPKAVP